MGNDNNNTTELQMGKSDLARGVFERGPVSYRVRRKSELKLAVSDRLRRFLGDFDDQTLVEYIIVLICNGKTQYQARDDLEEFIGENTEKFIAWLWDYLRKQNDDITEERETENSLKNKMGTQNEIRVTEADEQSGNTSLEKEGSIEERNYSAGAESEYPSRSFRISSEISNGGIQFSPYHEKDRHYKREQNIYRTEIPSRASRSFRRPRSEIVCHGHDSHFTNREEIRVREPEKIKPPNKKLEMDKGSKPRHKSIWDRLDKPQNEPQSLKMTKNNPFFVVRNPNPSPMPPLYNAPVPVPVPHFHPCPHLILPVPVPGFPNPGFEKPGFEIQSRFEMAGLRKRQFKQIEKDLHETRVPVKQRLKFVKPAQFGNNEKMQTQNGELDQVENQSDVQSEDKKEVPQNEILEMKLKLQEMEKNMNELRSNLKLDSKINSASEVPSNLLEELAQSRTVLVTNVHFVAKKEALVALFSQCGPVAKVVLLTDPVTAQPKGAAYVIFISKESAEKALSLNGTFFFSRVINVVRKADKPAGFLSPAQQARKLTHHLQFRRPTAHLQWKRETASSNNT